MVFKLQEARKFSPKELVWWSYFNIQYIGSRGWLGCFSVHAEALCVVRFFAICKGRKQDEDNTTGARKIIAHLAAQSVPFLLSPPDLHAEIEHTISDVTHWRAITAIKLIEIIITSASLLVHQKSE